jgi:hypothetical protein
VRIARKASTASAASPDSSHRPQSRLEAAYHKADTAIQDIVDLLAAA